MNTNRIQSLRCKTSCWCPWQTRVSPDSAHNQQPQQPQCCAGGDDADDALLIALQRDEGSGGDEDGEDVDRAGEGGAAGGLWPEDVIGEKTGPD